MISQRAAQMRPSGIRKMFERRAAMKDPIDFSIGQPHFDVPGPIADAAVEAIRGGHNHYTVTEGLPALNDDVADHVERRVGRRPERTMVTGGVSGGLMLAYLALLDPGDELLVPDPYFPVYRELAEVLGITVSYYDLYPDFRLRREALEAAASERSKVLLLNSPANPTGLVLSEEEVRLAADFASERGLTIVSDEIYDAFVYGPGEGGGELPSVSRYHESTLVLGGFSKSYGVPGWRLGWAAGPANVLAAMTTLQQFSFVCGNTPAQYGALAARDANVAPHRMDYQRKRDRLLAALAADYGPVVPGGAFYLFPPVPGGETGSSFVERAFERQLLLVPGKAFSCRDTHFRISYAVPDEKLERGIEVLLDLASSVGRSRSQT